jgi:hypothetical protein
MLNTLRIIAADVRFARRYRSTWRETWRFVWLQWTARRDGQHEEAFQRVDAIRRWRR